MAAVIRVAFGHEEATERLADEALTGVSPLSMRGSEVGRHWVDFAARFPLAKIYGCE